MTLRSLRVRLAVAAAFAIAVALLVTGFGLLALFERHVERRIGAELVTQLNQLTASVLITEDGNLEVDPLPTDPRFRVPLSGLYWQIDDQSTEPSQIGVLRSRSLWDSSIRPPADALEPGAIHAHVLPGPAQQSLLVRERLVLLDTGEGSKRLRLVTGIDRRELSSAKSDFAADMLPYLLLVGFVLSVATLVQVRIGLAPLETVRRGVAAIRSGRSRRLTERFPDEVMPLVTEVNALLGAREQALERARAWTADLAHGLKTPLSALAADAQKLRAEGKPALAADLEQLAEGMRRRVDRELIRARVRSGTDAAPARADVGAALGRLLNTLRRTPEGERIDWHLSVPDAVLAALPPDDLLELLGNLLENAAKWARSRVRIEVSSGPEQVTVRITDDGPGVPPEQLRRLGERGLRLDQSKDGSGLGLAIVRDVVGAYGGSLDLQVPTAGGLSAVVALPRASAH